MGEERGCGKDLRLISLCERNLPEPGAGLSERLPALSAGAGGRRPSCPLCPKPQEASTLSWDRAALFIALPSVQS